MPSPSAFTVSIPTTPTPQNHPDVIPIYIEQPSNSEDLYANGTFEQDLIAHGVNIKTSDRKQQQPKASKDASAAAAGVHDSAHAQRARDKAAAPKGRFYIKHQTPADVTVQSRYLPVPTAGHNRTVSDVSTASSIPSYFAPIPGSEYSDSIRPESTGNEYSYPYMDIPVKMINTKTRGDDVSFMTTSDATSHRYEQCTFPIRKTENNAKVGKKVAKTNSDSAELLEKISQQKGRLRPISKQLSFKVKDNSTEPYAEASPAPTSQPLTIEVEDSAGDYVNIQKAPSAKKEKTETSKKPKKTKAKGKDSSMKLGTSRFNAIRAKLEQNQQQGNDTKLDIKQLNVL